MKSFLEKLTLLTHVTFSVGWLGAVVVYLVLAGVAWRSKDAQDVAAGYYALELTGWFVIVPFSLAALLSGLVQSLRTEWGLFRYYWIVMKFVLTIGAVTILLLHMPVVSRKVGLGAEVLHAGGGLLVLLIATALSIFKPWGMTKYGCRKRSERRPALRSVAETATLSVEATWGYYFFLGAIGFVLLLLALHLIGRGHVGH